MAVVMTRKGARPRVRLGLIALGLIVLLGLWGVFRYGPGLMRRVSHSMSHEGDLSWNAPIHSSPISGYHVYRAKAGSSSYQLLNWGIVTETKFVDLTVQRGHTYDYYVKSVDAYGVESGPSNTIRVTVPWLPHLSAF